jgi:hypothetical protein
MTFQADKVSEFEEIFNSSNDEAYSAWHAVFRGPELPEFRVEVDSHSDKTFFILCSGPAKKIINQVQNNYRYVNSHLELRNCDLIITGSGWMSELENDVLRFCDSNNIPSLTILDHWINYRSRFFRGETATPSMLAVTNHVALDLAKEEYPKKPIWLLPDYHLESFLEYINLKNHKNNILILLPRQF